MTRQDIAVSPLIAVQSPRRAQSFDCFSSNASRANSKVKTAVGNGLTWNTCHYTHIPAKTHRASVWKVWSCWDAFKVSQRCRLLSDSIKVLWKHNQLNWAVAGERMLGVIKGFSDTALTVPWWRGKALVFQGENTRNCMRAFIRTAIIPDPGTEGWRRKRRDETRLKEGAG